MARQGRRTFVYGKQLRHLPPSTKAGRKGKYHISGFSPPSRGAAKEAHRPRSWYERICFNCHHCEGSNPRRCPKCRQEYAK